MDLWNNKIGREIFNEVKWELMGKRRKDYPPKRIEDIYAQKIVERMKNGDLITNPNDKRQFKDYGKYFRNKNQDNPTGQQLRLTIFTPANDRQNDSRRIFAK